MKKIIYLLSVLSLLFVVFASTAMAAGQYSRVCRVYNTVTGEHLFTADLNQLPTT